MVKEKDLKQKELRKKTCFIITPIGSEGSEIRREIEGIIDEVVNPVLKEFGYEENNVAHRKDNTSSIPSDVIKSVYEADLCIANLTGNNANVMYELALRHATGKHVIIITKDVSSLPFDISVQRAIEYKNDMQGALDLKNELRNKIKYIEEHDQEISNPIYDTLQKIIINDETIPHKDYGYKESIEKIMGDINELKTLIRKSNSTIKDIPLGYEEIFRNHNLEMENFKRKINMYNEMNDIDKLRSTIESLKNYVFYLEEKCDTADRYKEDAVYNEMFQEARIVLNGCKNLIR